MMQSSFSRVLIVIPTLNERDNLFQLIPSLFEDLADISVLIVDDRSTDGTREVVRQLRVDGYVRLFLLEREHNPGYGHSILDGLAWGYERGFEFIVTMDADFSHDYRAIPGMTSQMASCDISTGSRYVAGGGVENWHWQRRFLSKFSNIYVRLILGFTCHDATTGFVCYSRKVVGVFMELTLQSEGYAFLVESKYVLAMRSFIINEYPITFRERREGKSKMSWKVIWESILLPWRLRFSRK